MSQSLDEFEYELPRELIAQAPASPRDACKLLVQNLRDGTIRHRIFRDFADYLREGDVLVLNDSRVLPAKFKGKKSTGGRLEVLALTRPEDVRTPHEFEALIRGKIKEGDEIAMLDKSGAPFAHATLTDKNGGRCRVLLTETEYETVLRAIGEAPLPPYIKKQMDTPDSYQTIFSKNDGSIAAPTAGLHFTHALMEKIKNKGVRIAYVTLHIGSGTFLHVDEEAFRSGSTEPEYFSVASESADMINAAIASGNRIIPVGTTSVKALESAAGANGKITTLEGMSTLFIAPGYEFRVPIAAFLTNFHLPKSSLLLLTAAYGGKENLMRAYAEAIRERYLFYSFGDAMFIIKR